MLRLARQTMIESEGIMHAYHRTHLRRFILNYVPESGFAITHKL